MKKVILCLITAILFLTLAGCENDSIEERHVKVIDMESHYYLPELLEYLSTRTDVPRYDNETKFLQFREGAAGMSFSIPSLNGDKCFYDDITDFGENRLAIMDKTGIDVAALSSAPLIEDLPDEDAIKFARMSNDKVYELTQKYPNRFIGAATLPSTNVDEAIKELHRCVEELGFKYWHTNSNYFHEHLYDEKYEPLLAEAEKLGCAIYIHPHFADDKELLDADLGYMYTGAGLGFGQDVMRTCTRMIINGTFDRYPSLTIIIGHLGEYFPFILDRMDNRFGQDPHRIMKHDISWYFRNGNILVTTSGNPSKEAFECTIKKLGIKCIMFGSDYPFESCSDALDFLNSIGLSAQEKEQLFHGNAEKYIMNK